MKLTAAERLIFGLTLTALALMGLTFALRALPTGPLAAIPAAAPTVTAAGEEVPEDERVNINTATLEELMSLPGIGEVRARAILEYREEHGPFRYAEDLILVNGIGEGIVSGLLNYVTTGG